MVSRKKKLKNQDFAKVKLKVGKSNEAANATDTTFKSRAIVLSGQALGEDKGVGTNQRNLSLKELLGQLRHYNGNVRKDAVAGMKDLFQRHPDILPSELAIIIEKISPLVLDGDSSVRQALQSLFTHILQSMPTERVRPFFPVPMVYLRSAMTHVREDISVAAFDFLDIFLHHSPSLVTASCKGLLLNFVRVLEKPSQGMNDGKGKMSATGQSTFRQARDRLLERLRGFLQELIRHRSNGKRKWDDMSTDTVDAAQNALTTHYDPQRAVAVEAFCVYPKAILTNAPLFELLGADAKGDDLRSDDTASEFGTKNNTPAATDSSQTDDAEWNSLRRNDLATTAQTLAFIRAIHPIIVKAWVEVAPICFGPGNAPAWSMSQLQSMLSILQLCWRRFFDLRAMEGSDSCGVHDPAYLKDYARHFLLYFPYNANSKDSKMAAVCKDMSLSMCDILAVQLALLGSTNADETATTATDAWLERVLTYGEASLETINSQTPPHVVETLVALLDAVLFCPAVDDLGKHSLLTSTLAALQKTPPTTTASGVLLRYLSSIFLTDRYSEIEDLRGDGEPTDMSTLNTFVLMLPRLLWNLKGAPAHVRTAKVLINAMRVAALQHPQYADARGKNMQAISAILQVSVPSKTKGEHPRKVFGPFIRMPLELQLRFLDVFEQPHFLTAQLLQRLLAAVLHKSVSVDVSTYMCELVGRSCARYASTTNTTVASTDHTPTADLTTAADVPAAQSPATVPDALVDTVAAYASYFVTLTMGRTSDAAVEFARSHASSRKDINLQALRSACAPITSYGEALSDWVRISTVCDTVSKVLIGFGRQDGGVALRQVCGLELAQVVSQGLVQTLQHTGTPVCLDSALASLMVIYRCESEFDFRIAQDVTVDITLQVMSHGCAVGNGHYMEQFVLQYIPLDDINALLRRALTIFEDQNSSADIMNLLGAVTKTLQSTRLLDLLGTPEVKSTLQLIAQTQASERGDHVRAFRAALALV